MSTLDLFGRGFVLLTAEDGRAWANAARGLDIAVHAVPGSDFITAYGLAPSRPDGFVAWRARTLSRDPDGELKRVLGTVLSRGAGPNGR